MMYDTIEKQVDYGKMVSRLEFYQCHAENVLTFTKAGAGEIENMNKKKSE